MLAQGFTNEGTLVPDGLQASEFPIVAKKVVVTPGGTLTRGTLLGRITTGGKFITSLSAASDGSQTPRAVLAHDVTAASGDVEAIVYVTGHFRSAAMTFGASHTAASVADGLRTLGIHLD